MLMALRRSKMGALIIAVQIALTMAMVSNIASIVAARTALFARPTGTDEQNLFALGFRFTDNDGTKGMLETDIRSVLSVPDVVDMVSTNSYPLRGSGFTMGVGLTPGENGAQAAGGLNTVYLMDTHGVTTLGLQLTAGRNFRNEEIITGDSKAGSAPGVAIVTSSLARSLFGSKEALGKVVYLSSGPGSPPLTIVGIVKQLQSTRAAGTLDPRESENSIILPVRTAGPIELFVIRVKPGSLKAAMAAVQAALVRNDRNRVFGRLRPFGEIRASAYQKDRSISIVLTIAAVILIGISVLSITGLTSYWVARRRLQIGIRRALGATRAAIIQYFLLENAILCLTGVALGSAIALSVNRWLFVRYGVGPIPMFDLVVCCVTIVVVGQLAAVVPAARAARDDPAATLRVIK